MNNKFFKVVCYEMRNTGVESVLTIYKGTHKECLDFYKNNENEYIKQGKNLTLMFI